MSKIWLSLQCPMFSFWYFVAFPILLFVHIGVKFVFLCLALWFDFITVCTIDGDCFIFFTNKWQMCAKQIKYVYIDLSNCIILRFSVSLQPTNNYGTHNSNACGTSKYKQNILFSGRSTHKHSTIPIYKEYEDI